MPTSNGLPDPPDEYLRLAVDADLLLLAAAARLRQHWATHAAAKGLSAAQIKVLLALAPGEAVPMRVLASRMDYDASNLTTIVDRLQSRGLVMRQPDQNDRRVKSLTLTATGESTRSRFWADLVDNPGPLQPLSHEEVQTLIRILTKLEL